LQRRRPAASTQERAMRYAAPRPIQGW
jgi:hypothetical protein